MGYFSNAFGNYKCAVSATSGEPVVFVARREDWKMGTIWNRGLRGLAVALCLTLVFAPVVQAEAMTNAAAGVIHGRVFLADSALPVIGVSVQVVDLESAEVVAEATTDDNGVATMPELPYGTYHVQVQAPGGMVASSAPLITIDADNSAPMVEFRLEAAVQDETADGERQDTVESVDGSTIKMSGGLEVMTNAATEWVGEHGSADAVGSALEDGDVCATFEGSEQPSGDFIATRIDANTCDEATAGIFAAAGAALAAAALAGGISTALIVGLAALGAAGLTAGVVAVTAGAAEVVTQ